MSHFEVSPREREDEARRWQHEFGVDEYAPCDILGNELAVDPDDKLEFAAGGLTEGDASVAHGNPGPPSVSSFRCARCGHDLKPEDELGCPECAGTQLEAA